MLTARREHAGWAQSQCGEFYSVPAIPCVGWAQFSVNSSLCLGGPFPLTGANCGPEELPGLSSSWPRGGEGSSASLLSGEPVTSGLQPQVLTVVSLFLLFLSLLFFLSCLLAANCEVLSADIAAGRLTGFSWFPGNIANPKAGKSQQGGREEEHGQNYSMVLGDLHPPANKCSRITMELILNHLNNQRAITSFNYKQDEGNNRI